MNNQNKIIKQALKSNLIKLDEEMFTENIIKIYLDKKAKSLNTVKFDSISLILCLVLILVFLGLGFIISTQEIQGLTIEHLMILLSSSIAFLIFRLLNEIVTPNNRYSSLPR
jgi:hypothetical protein